MISIGNKQIGNKVFIIAEIGCNFENDFERAKEMIREAAKAGADAIKLQTFNPEKLVTKNAPKFWDIEGCPGETQFEEFKAMFQPSFEQYKELKKIADKEGILFFSTPYDEDSVEMLEKLGINFYKISSMDLTHIPLLRYIAKKGKPIIISTGASTISEIKESIAAIEKTGNKQIILLHCISNYPNKLDNVHLNMIKSLTKEFPDYIIGYSDHTKMPETKEVFVAAVALGAKVLEKHFTFDNSRPGYDHEISADYKELADLVHSVRITEKILGSSEKKPTESEKKMRDFGRRSIVSNKIIKKGEVITADMISIKRPGGGIEPKFLDEVIGKKAKKDIIEDDVLFWDVLE